MSEPQTVRVSAFGHVLERATHWLAMAGTVCVLLMMLHITLEVVLRYTLGIVLPGTLIFVANYYMIFVLFLPFALLELKNRHLAVDVLVQHLPGGLQWALKLLAKVVTMLIMAAMTWAAWGQAAAKFRLGETIDQGNSSVIVWPGYFAIVAGCALMTLVAGARALELIVNRDLGLGEESSE